MSRPPHQSFPTSKRLTPLAFLLGAFCSCSGGGGGSGADARAPTLVGAAFVGGRSPAPGDTLLLTFSEGMRTAIGATVGSAEFALSGGDTLGTATTVQSQPTTTTMVLLLGTGVTFTPGTTTLDFASTNATIADAGGNSGDPGAAITIEGSDGAAPTIDRLTVAAIDQALNGTGPAGGTLQASTTAARFSVPATVILPAGPLTFTVVVVDGGGLASTAATFDVTVRAFTDALRPFETTVNAQQVWFLDTSRDVESFSTLTAAGVTSIEVTTGASGRSDFLDVLHVMGLQTTTPQTGSGTDSNIEALDLLRSRILAELAGFYAGCNVSFTWTQPTGNFGTTSSFSYGSFGYSQICLGGAFDATSAVLGVAQFDPNNTRQNNNCLLEDGTNPRLGVFLHTIADGGFRSSAGTTFRVLFNQLAPALGGNPIGTVANDLQRLLGTQSDGRAALIEVAVEDIARYLAVVLAHECGHSHGLVQNGAQPTGLYGNDTVNFPSSTNGHIRTPLLFPNGGINIMSPSLSYTLATDPNTAFNSLNLAYLREQVSYGN